MCCSPTLIVSALLIAAAPPADDKEYLFVSPMGEPFRGDKAAPPEVAWFDGADANHDGKLTRDELAADAARFFKRVDRNGDGEIDGREMERYESWIADEIDGSPVLGRNGVADYEAESFTTVPNAPAGPVRYLGREGAARFNYFALPQPVIAADTNFDRGVDAREFQAAAALRFAALDTNKDGFIPSAELPRPPRVKVRKR